MVLLAGACGGERWRWEEDGAGAASVRIDTKVRFVDDSTNRSVRHTISRISLSFLSSSSMDVLKWRGVILKQKHMGPSSFEIHHL